MRVDKNIRGICSSPGDIRMTRREFRDPCHTIRYACSVLWILSLHTGEPECGSTLVVMGKITSKLLSPKDLAVPVDDSIGESRRPIYRTGVCLRHSLASASHSLRYRPRRANTPFTLAQRPRRRYQKCISPAACGRSSRSI